MFRIYRSCDKVMGAGESWINPFWLELELSLPILLLCLSIHFLDNVTPLTTVLLDNYPTWQSVLKCWKYSFTFFSTLWLSDLSDPAVVIMTRSSPQSYHTTSAPAKPSSQQWDLWLWELVKKWMKTLLTKHACCWKSLVKSLWKK